MKDKTNTNQRIYLRNRLPNYKVLTLLLCSLVLYSQIGFIRGEDEIVQSPQDVYNQESAKARVKKLPDLPPEPELSNGTDGSLTEVYTKAGVTTTFNNEFSNLFKVEILDLLMNKISQTKLPDGHHSFRTPQATYNISMSDVQITDLTYNHDNFEVQMRDEEPHVQVTMKNIAMNVSFTYELETHPNDIDENGYGHAIFKNLEIVFEVNPYLLKNQVQVDISNLVVNSNDDISLILKGGDLSEHLTSFLGVFKEHLRHQLVIDLQKSLLWTAQVSANIVIANIPSHFKLSQSIIMNNLIRDQKLKLNSNYWAFGGDGTFYINHGTVYHNEKVSRMGVHDPSLGDFQVFFSNRSATSLLRTAKHSKDLRVDNIPIQINTLAQFIQGINKVFSKQNETMVSIDFQKEFKPFVTFNETGAYCVVGLDLEIKNPLNLEQNAAVIKITSTARLNFTIVKELHIQIMIEEMSSKVTYFEPYFYSGSNTFTIQNYVNVINTLLMDNLNEKILSKEPLLVGMFAYNTEKLKQGQIKFYRHYIGLGAKVAQPLVQQKQKHLHQDLNENYNFMNQQYTYMLENGMVKLLEKSKTSPQINKKKRNKHGVNRNSQYNQYGTSEDL
eukprot:403343680